MPEHNFQFNWLGIPDQRRQLAEAMLFQFSQTEKFPPEQLAQLQLAHLKNLVQHCLTHVPYYRNGEYFPIHNWQDWGRLPLLSRRALQDNSNTLRADINLENRDGKVYEKRTSGSTGRPVKVLVSERNQVYWNANTIRDHLWQQRDFNHILAVIKYQGQRHSAPPGQASRNWGAGTGTLYATGPAVIISSSTPIDDQFDWLQKVRPGYLLTYPSLLRALAEKNLASNRPLQLGSISTIGESLGPDTRELARGAFGARVADIYSCQELGYMALQCPRHDHYHVTAESSLVEVLDDNNRPCAPGEMGRVVVTALHNRVMPLIRYDIGDYAIAGGSCDCGIRLPVLERVIGRTRNLVHYPDGSRSWPLYNAMKMMDLISGAQFQLVQKTSDTLLLRIGTDTPVAEPTLQALKSIINEAIGYPFNILFEQVADIPRSNSGKFEEFISEMAPE
ncbi:MAG: phenylacetate--CoA ligase family protein [Pseudomonadales bacterium]|nr:phenylacetate--CoA ligase family protein [Pseudomonadales bacterium]